MNIEKFKIITGFQEPLLCIQGDIFDTPADHIAFAVNYPNKDGQSENGFTGFAGEVCRRFWPGLNNIVFTKGEVRSHRSQGKTFHALAVHTNEVNGWQDAPQLIESCLNRIPVGSEEVITIVLIGGGKAGKKWKASVNNIVGMSRSYKTVVLYIKEEDYFQTALRLGVIRQSIPLQLLPKTKKYRAQLAS